MNEEINKQLQSLTDQVADLKRRVKVLENGEKVPVLEVPANIPPHVEPPPVDAEWRQVKEDYFMPPRGYRNTAGVHVAGLVHRDDLPTEIAVRFPPYETTYPQDRDGDLPTE